MNKEEKNLDELTLEEMETIEGEAVIDGEVETVTMEEAPPSPEEKIAELEAEIASLNDQYIRKVAEFDNYRKRTIKEKEEIGLTAKIGAVAELLPVLDTLERAIMIGSTDEEFLRGVKLTYDNMTNILKKMGVEEIPGEGTTFDPNLHYAVARVENPELGENVIASVMQKGYTLSGKVVRHAMVAVANA